MIRVTKEKQYKFSVKCFNEGCGILPYSVNRVGADATAIQHLTQHPGHNVRLVATETVWLTTEGQDRVGPSLQGPTLDSNEASHGE